MLEKICGRNDLLHLNDNQLIDLSKEIRQFLIDSIGKTGGHLGSNLGAVELTLALNYVYDFQEDAIVYDVGHQAYVHKILTGRKEQFKNLREYQGLCGFPNINESPYDHFDTGHASTSISAAIGIAKAFELQGKKNRSVAVIGDGALSGGLAYEALNNIGSVKNPILVILNDNEMSISKNVGGMSKYLSLMRTSKQYNSFKEIIQNGLDHIPFVGNNLSRGLRKAKNDVRDIFVGKGQLFETFGVKYIGPIDGHNLPLLIDILNNVKDSDVPILLHVITKKGKGYTFAEENPSKFHGVEPFDYHTGDFINGSKGISYTKVFGDKLVKMANKYDDIVAITAAMSQGTGLENFKDLFPKRFFDVGIAEEHAVTFASGLACKGIRPVVAIYSTFLQRSLDQLIHDACLEDFPIIFALDRAGIVGKDGKTHQGIFDLSYLSFIPNLVILAPSSKEELEMAMEYAYHQKHPIAIRYPRGIADSYQHNQAFELGRGVEIRHGHKGLLISCGSLLKDALKLANDFDLTLVDARFVKPLDEEYYQELTNAYDVIITLEENVKTGGFNSLLRNMLNRKIHALALPDDYLEHGDTDVLKRVLEFDYEGLKKRITTIMNEED